MPILTINNFSGGHADSIYSGIGGSFSPNSYGLDIHGEPGILQANQALATDSGPTVVDLLLWALNGSDGNGHFLAMRVRVLRELQMAFGQ